MSQVGDKSKAAIDTKAALKQIEARSEIRFQLMGQTLNVWDVFRYVEMCEGGRAISSAFTVFTAFIHSVDSDRFQEVNQDRTQNSHEVEANWIRWVATSKWRDSTERRARRNWQANMLRTDSARPMSGSNQGVNHAKHFLVNSVRSVESGNEKSD